MVPLTSVLCTYDLRHLSTFYDDDDLLRTATPILNKFLRNTFPSLTADGDFRAVLVIVEFTNDCCPDKARIFRARARVRIVVGLELELGDDDDDDDDDVVVYPVVVLIAVDAELLS